MKTSLPALLDKALQLQSVIIADRGARPLAALAADLDLPQATAYRVVSALVAQGMLIRNERGPYFAGPRLLGQMQHIDPVHTLASVSAPFIQRLAKNSGQVAHLGILEGDMVTYVVKAGTGPIASFAQQGKQLEAYCSGLGKILLAGLPEAERELYLKNGPFVRLTPRTILDPASLRTHLDMVRKQGFALDMSEIAEGLNCIAVPVMDASGVVRAAISVSAPSEQFDVAFQHRARNLLLVCAAAVTQKIYPQLGFF